MTPDEARDLFGAAIDGELDDARQKELDALLATDEALRTELEELRAIVRETNALGAAEVETPAPDLLGGVQAKLRKRSGGRFYKDRFAEGGGRSTVTPLVLAAVMLVLVGLVFLALEWTQVVEPPQRSPGPPPHQGSEER